MEFYLGLASPVVLPGDLGYPLHRRLTIHVSILTRRNATSPLTN
jgi:hypothetical protein